MRLAAFDRLAADRIAVMGLADGIQAALARPATAGDLQQVAFEVIDGNDRRIRPLVKLEERLMDGIWSASIEAQADQGTAGIMAAMQMLRTAVETGRPLRPALESVELEIRAFIESRDRLVRDLRRQSSPALLARLEARFEEYESQLVRPQSLATK